MALAGRFACFSAAGETPGEISGPAGYTRPEMEKRPRVRLVAGVFVLMAVAVAAADQPPPVHDLRVVSQELPAELETAAMIGVPLVVANDGEADWSPDEGFALAYHWLDRAGEMVVRDGHRTAFPQTLEVGGEIAVIAQLQAPATAGEYLLQWDVVHEGHVWVARVDPTPVTPVPVTVYAGHAFSVTGGNGPRLLSDGRTEVVRLTVRNDGRRTWKEDGTFAFSYHWLDNEGEVVEWDGRRTTVPHPVRAGETVDLDVAVEPPPNAGLYRLQWDWSKKRVCWFSDRMPEPPPSLRVVVVPDIFRIPAVWAFAVLLAAAAAVAAAGSSGGSRRWIVLVAASDLVWCLGQHGL